MNPQLKLKIAKLVSRTACLHISKSGRHCHFPAIADSSYCLRHIVSHADEVVSTQIVPTHDDQHLDADLTPHFPDQPLNFKSACDVNDFLSALAGLIVRNHISTRRATVLAYIASLQLRTLRPMDYELNGGSDFEQVPRLDFGPSPDPDDTTSPSDPTYPSTFHPSASGHSASDPRYSAPVVSGTPVHSSS
jgi:hypothetical protein